MPTVEWAGVWQFTLGTVERPATKYRPRAVRGPRAIRVPRGAGRSQVFAPCAYVAPSAPPAPSSATVLCLYEDADAQRLLCCLVAEDGQEGQDGQEGERRFHVSDGQGKPIGTIRRVPPSGKLFKHTWRISQPGHPEIAGRNQWSGHHVKRLAKRAAGNIVPEVLNAVTGMGVDETYGKASPKSRTLEWVSDGDVVMVSESIKLITIKKDWLDRRLAFAFAVLGDR
ncbi:hypothetical protein N4G70_35105 [Streptomyces sp. ASQP_92]|uniref:hypothetical protein n=1 Tax=Streptomyces sp. ASQP_92 TaxID=2979116 RepID=UPI0021C0B073|nr:hypothetical protein [Streptomyces sp. ASQP_92]MCT9094046.1 hypothetical protein [Streptomyces sp. ASQP_92]